MNAGEERMWSAELDEQTIVSDERKTRGGGTNVEQFLIRMNEDFRLGPTLRAGTRAPSRGNMFSDVVAIASKPASSLSNRTAPANASKQFLSATDSDGACGERGRCIIVAEAAAEEKKTGRSGCA